MTSPGSSHVLWMTEYNQLFSLTPDSYTFQSWVAQGWQVILKDRLNALWVNLGTGILAQGSVLLTPFILIGGWNKRSLFPVRLAFLGWVLLLLVESYPVPVCQCPGWIFPCRDNISTRLVYPCSDRNGKGDGIFS